MVASINDLPEVVLEYILLQLSPYSDLHACSQVNRLWNVLAKRAMVKIRRDLELAVQSQQLQWFTRPLQSSATCSHIQKRHSHSCAVLGQRMYVFGGCTSNTSTTYNDLWWYDLGRRVWVKPLSFGTYPPPKACASLITHRGKLVLFGGWAHTSPYYPLYNSWRIFDHIHIYDPVMNCWTEVNRMATSGCCPATAGHSATLFREDKMLLFGGLQALDDGRGPPYNMSVASNDVWLLNLRSMMWSKQKIQGTKPKPRYGHSQIALDDGHIFIIGGCSGPDDMLYDMWLLEACSGSATSDTLEWKWYPIDVVNQKNGAPRLSFHPACRVGDRVVMLGRSRYGAKIVPQTPARAYSPLQIRPLGSSFTPSTSRLNRGPASGAAVRQAGAAAMAASPTHAAGWKSTMCVYALDISELVESRKVRWVERAEALGRAQHPPEHLVLYTLVKGQGELLMFGGIRRESGATSSEFSANSETASNVLYSLSFTHEVI
ncbi:F-box only protein 42-like [Tropilaelaps mercedesae]|uniref:F-box only protein 42-like n=1 Tax=Tropilaelaps mercedesae TaxID=418985 RepID=A0A1V9XGE2_9ACAR|nr:F-box only protein 42-like [Tropilaelaps mercedesae]